MSDTEKHGTAAAPTSHETVHDVQAEPDEQRDERSERLPRLLVLSPSADLYGADRALEMALPAIVERFEVTIVCAVDGPAVARAEALGAEVILSEDWALRRRGLRPTAIPSTVSRVMRSLLHLRRLHRERCFDLVYANTVANAMLPFVPSYVSVPLVVHVREVPRDRGRLAAVLFGALDRSADLVLCNSGFTQSCVLRLAPGLETRVRVVHDGITPFDEIEHPPRAADAVLNVVCVGRIHPKKGQATLIEAVRLAAERGYRFQLHFWGDALPEHAELEAELHAAVAAADLAAWTSWNGYQSDTRSLYAGMDIAVVPSVLPEEFSLVTAEGQLAGLPVVATGPGGPSEIIEEGVTGTIVPPKDPSALADALIQLVDGDRRSSWGAAGRRRVLELFTTERYAPAVVRELVFALGLAPRRRFPLPIRVPLRAK